MAVEHTLKVQMNCARWENAHKNCYLLIPIIISPILWLNSLIEHPKLCSEYKNQEFPWNSIEFNCLDLWYDPRFHSCVLICQDSVKANIANEYLEINFYAN